MRRTRSKTTSQPTASPLSLPGSCFAGTSSTLLAPLITVAPPQQQPQPHWPLPCVQLKVKITRQLAAREQKLRRRNLTKYIPNAAAAVFKVLQSMAEAPARGQKRKRMESANDILSAVKRHETREETLAQLLTEHVERIDTDMVRWQLGRQRWAERLRGTARLMTSVVQAAAACCGSRPASPVCPSDPSRGTASAISCRLPRAAHKQCGPARLCTV